MRLALFCEWLSGSLPLLLALLFFGRLCSGRAHICSALGMTAAWSLLTAFSGQLAWREPLLLFAEFFLPALYGMALFRCSAGRSLLTAALLMPLVDFSNGFISAFVWPFSSCLPVGRGCLPQLVAFLLALLPLPLLAFLLVRLQRAFGGQAFSKGQLASLAAPLLLVGAAQRAWVSSLCWSALQEPSRQAEDFLPLLFALACFACLLAALHQLEQAVRARGAARCLQLRAAGEAVRLERIQEQEGRLRCFRHDLHNHLLVIAQLLREEKTDGALRYIGGLQTMAELPAVPCQTGNPAADVLLGAKLAAAEKEGIRASCRLRLPEGIADVDWCRLFSNALDNAIHAACEAPEERRYLRLEGRQQGNLFLLEVENGCGYTKKPPREGTGLQSLRAVARTYHGALDWEQTAGVFRLHVLLRIPQR